MSIRVNRVGSEIKKALSLRLLKTPGIVTILRVEMSKDLSIAKVYYSVFGSKLQCDETLKFLENNKKNLRMEIASAVKLRVVPELYWVKDITAEKVQLIREIMKN